MRDEDDIIELNKRRSEKGEEVFEYDTAKEKPASQLARQFAFWAMVVGGVAVGTVLFLFFITLFVYFFVPLFIIFLVWTGLKYLIGKNH